ncbi:unnamed protein product [Symbiodinium necroappetens]|uniref:Uncharacterized protein n=1 Tax=Symbiodinium necroappetens TaxID=1628268 RepID=A0A812K1B8_9DINO|nr:unnamed protein product [Symbiodinium necroappetens]
MLKSRLTDCEFDGILRNLLVEESGRPAAKLFWRPPKMHSQAKDASGAYTSPSGHGFCYQGSPKLGKFVFDAQEAFDSMCSRFKAVMEQYEAEQQGLAPQCTSWVTTDADFCPANLDTALKLRMRSGVRTIVTFSLELAWRAELIDMRRFSRAPKTDTEFLSVSEYGLTATCNRH